MTDSNDEVLARSAAIGTLAHRIIVGLAAEGRTPSFEQVTAAVRAELSCRPIEKRAHQQNLISITTSYFRSLLPPPGWAFAGSEVHLGVGRADLVWRHEFGSVLIDELKTGSAIQLGTSATREQVRRLAAAAQVKWGAQFAGVRLLSPADPRRSLHLSPSGDFQSLFTTSYT